MPVDIDYSNLPEFPQKLAEKLIQIRERSGRTWDEFAQQVNARDGTEIAAYENNEGDLPISVLYAYARFAGIPVENIIDDDRDLWFGHRQDHERPRRAVLRRRNHWVNCLTIIGFIVVVSLLGPPLLGLVLWFIRSLWEALFVS
jgi:transcriptional regulator with XRE-family HTH domain